MIMDLGIHTYCFSIGVETILSGLLGPLVANGNNFMSTASETVFGLISCKVSQIISFSRDAKCANARLVVSSEQGQRIKTNRNSGGGTMSLGQLEESSNWRLTLVLFLFFWFLFLSFSSLHSFVFLEKERRERGKSRLFLLLFFFFYRK